MTGGTTNPITVTVAPINEVRVGQIIWAHNDSDWLKVRRIKVDPYGDVIVYRLDGSEASFTDRQKVLVRG